MEQESLSLVKGEVWTYDQRVDRVHAFLQNHLKRLEEIILEDIKSTNVSYRRLGHGLYKDERRAAREQLCSAIAKSVELSAQTTKPPTKASFEYVLSMLRMLFEEEVVAAALARIQEEFS